MNDSQQINNYLQIVQSLLASKKQWNQVPEIVSLTFKAISHLLMEYKESFSEHKTLINEQSLKIKQQEMRLASKISKKQFQVEMVNLMKYQPGNKKEEDSISQYEKLIKQSRYSRVDKQKYDNTTIQQLKTIAQIIAQKKLFQLQRSLQSKGQAHKEVIQQKFLILRQQLKNKFFEHEKQLRQVKQKMTQYKSNWNRLEQSNIKLIHSLSQQKIIQLQNSNKILSNNINEIINHIQNNYISKAEMQRNEQKMKNAKTDVKQKVKSQIKQKSNKIDKDQEIIKLIQSHLSKLKEKQYKQWYQFKQNVNKQIGQMIKMQTITQLLEQFQKQMLEKHYFLSNTLSKFQQKMNKNECRQKQILVKSEKRAEKRSSPQKSMQSIQAAILRLQKIILQKQSGQNLRISSIVQENMGKFDTKMIKQLDRRQRHLCQVIEQTYNQSINKKGQNSHDVKASIKKLFQTNIFCRYLYHGLKQCKKDSFISWEQQIQNSLIQNFIWKKDTILINSGGVYRVQLALFGQIQNESHILINDIKIAIVNRPQLTKNTGIKVKGSYFNQLLLLPNKSKASIKVNQHFYGKAYLSIQKL